MSVVTDAQWRHAADLRAVLEQIWESLTEGPDELCFLSTAEPIGPGTSIVSAAIDLRGDWEGSVHLICPTTMADAIAAQMLSLPIEDLIAEDVDDALGEVANIIGGNVKSLLDGVEQLTLPQVTRTVAPDGIVVNPLHTCTATWRGMTLLVQVVQQS